MECGKCGYRNQAGDVYCRKCGQALDEQVRRDQPAYSPSDSSRKPITKIGKKPLGIGCLLGPIVGGGISSIVGVIIGHISSFLYSLMGDTQNSGLAYLLTGVTFLLSFLLSMGLGLVAKKIGLKPK